MPEGSFSVRAARASDIAALARFQTDTWREAYAGLVPAAYLDGVDADTRQARWQQRYDSGDVQIGLALDPAHRVVGAASSCARRDDVGSDPPPELELRTLYLARTTRGTGLADRLTDFVIGDRSAYLWVFSANARAIAFYTRIGFTPDGHAKIDPDTGVAELRMTRSGPVIG